MFEVLFLICTQHLPFIYEASRVRLQVGHDMEIGFAAQTNKRRNQYSIFDKTTRIIIASCKVF